MVLGLLAACQPGRGDDSAADSSSTSDATAGGATLTQTDATTTTPVDDGSESDSANDTTTAPASDTGGGDQPVALFEHEARDLTLSLDDAGSMGLDGPVVEWSWDFGDGTSADGRTPALHVYEAPGAYDVTLTVVDEQGATASITQSVDVAPREPGAYAPDADSTGVPAVVADRLHLIDLEKPDKSPTNTPSVAEETLRVTKDGDDWVLVHDGAVIELPPENGYVDGDRFVIDRVHVRGYVQVQAPNVTLRRSVVEAVLIPDAPDAPAPDGVDVGRRLVRGNDAATVDLRLEDLEIVVPEEIRRGRGVNPGYHHGIGLEASRLSLLRSEIAGTVDGMQIHQGGAPTTDVRIERSWLHAMQFHEIDLDRADGDSTHSDGIQVECSMPAAGQLFGVRIEGSVIDMTSDANLNAAIMVTRNACATHGAVIRANFLDGAVFPINVGSGNQAEHIELYVDENRFGPNRATGSVPDKTWTTSTTARVVAAKANTDGSSAYDNVVPGGAQQWVYFSFAAPAMLGEPPPSGEPNLNVIVDHDLEGTVWGTEPLAAGTIGMY